MLSVILFGRDFGKDGSVGTKNRFKNKKDRKIELQRI